MIKIINALIKDKLLCIEQGNGGLLNTEDVPESIFTEQMFMNDKREIDTWVHYSVDPLQYEYIKIRNRLCTSRGCWLTLHSFIQVNDSNILGEIRESEELQQIIACCIEQEINLLGKNLLDKNYDQKPCTYNYKYLIKQIKIGAGIEAEQHDIIWERIPRYEEDPYELKFEIKTESTD